MENKTEYSKYIRNRLSRNIGHLAKVKEMIDAGEDFERVMLQFRAARSALASTSNALVAEKAQAEVIAALDSGKPEAVLEFYKDYSKYF